MITVTQASEKIVKRSRYLTEALSKNLINISSLARYIKPEVEQLSLKQVSEASIIMSLTRLSKKIHPISQYQPLFKKSPEITVRSPLLMIKLDVSHISSLVSILNSFSDQSFFRLSVSEREILLIVSENTNSDLDNIIKSNQSEIAENLAAISIKLPESALDTPGAFYFFLKSLTWEHINIVELFTQRTEFTIIVKEKDADRAYGVIKTLFV